MISPSGRVPQKEDCSQSLYRLPFEFYQNGDRPATLSAGDREALSTLIAAYSFSPHVYDMMRYIAALNSTIQGYLVKKNNYGKYQEIFTDITQQITNARIYLNMPQEHGRAAAILYALETALKIIAEREGLTQTGANMYDGRMPIAPANTPLEEDGFDGI